MVLTVKTALMGTIMQGQQVKSPQHHVCGQDGTDGQDGADGYTT